MAAMKVHGSPFSTATTRVLAALFEKELEFEFIPVDMGTGAHKKEPFIRFNPFGQVPAFEDGDLKLFGLLTNIAHEYAGKETADMPRLKEDGDVGVCLEVEAHQFDPVASKLTWELAIKPMFGMTADEAEVEENQAELGKVLDIYEVRLAESKYVGGGCFTLADQHHLPTIHYLLGTKSKKLFDSRPHVSAWVADITSRPAWSKVLAMQKK